MNLLLTFCLLIFGTWVSYSQKYDVKAIAEIDLGHSLGQLRAVPVSLGTNRPKAIAAMYSEDAEIDPYIGMFFFLNWLKDISKRMERFWTTRVKR